MARLAGLEPATLGLEGISSVIARRLYRGAVRGGGLGLSGVDVAQDVVSRETGTVAKLFRGPGQRRMQARSVIILEIIIVVRGHQLEFRAFREIDRFVEHQAAVTNARDQGERHGSQSNTEAGPVADLPAVGTARANGAPRTCQKQLDASAR